MKKIAYQRLTGMLAVSSALMLGVALFTTHAYAAASISSQTANGVLTVVGISGDGTRIVGNIKEPSSCHGFNISGCDFESYMWSQADGYNYVGTAGGGSTGTGLGSVAFAISRNGKAVVGYYKEYYNSLPFAYIWREGVGRINISTNAQTSHDMAKAVNADGTVVAGTTGQWGSFAWRWTDADGMVALDPNYNFGSSDATGIDDVGDVIVGQADSQAFRWNQTDGIVQLGTLAGDSSSIANAVSGNGKIVIGTSTGATDQAFKWTQSGGMVGLGALDQYGITQASKISSDGSTIIGQNVTTSTAMFWNGNTTTNLGSFDSTYTQTGANSVSDDGSVIVGQARNPNDGSYIAYKWTQSGGMIDLGNLGGPYTSANGVSGDGNVVVGTSYTAGYQNFAFKWTQSGGMENLGTIGGTGWGSGAYAANTDGSIIVGYSYEGAYTPMYWTQGTGMVGLGTLPGGCMYCGQDTALGLSDDGSIIAGRATTGTNDTRVFRWTQGTGMVDIGTLTGSGNTSFGGISKDGSTIVGQSPSTLGGQEAFKYTLTDGMSGLGFLDNAYHDSSATGVNANGSVIVGYATTSNGYSAFKWTQADGMVALAAPLTTGSSYAHALNQDGSIIVGQTTTTDGNRAFVWQQSTGMKRLDETLQAKGVDLTGWVLSDASGISNKDIVVGNGTQNGSNIIYIANTTLGGVTTPQAVVNSLQSANQASQQIASISSNNLSQILFTARNISRMASPIMIAENTFTMPTGDDPQSFAFMSPAAGGDFMPRMKASRYSLYTTGSYGIGQDNDTSNHGLDGTLGVNVALTPSLNLGVGMIASKGHSELPFNGNDSVDALGGSTILSYEGQSGLRLYGAAFVSSISLDMDRGYANGAGIDHSTGSTRGMAYGGAGQVGWEFPVTQKLRVMPYNEWDYSKTSLDAFNETGGAFPAQFSKQNSDTLISRLGAQFNYDQSDVLRWSFRAAWGHRLDDGGARFTATSAGLSQSIGGEAGDRNWGEAAVGLGWQATEKMRLSGEVAGRSGNTAEPQVTLTFGASVSF